MLPHTIIVCVQCHGRVSHHDATPPPRPQARPITAHYNCIHSAMLCTVTLLPSFGHIYTFTKQIDMGIIHHRPISIHNLLKTVKYHNFLFIHSLLDRCRHYCHPHPLRLLLRHTPWRKQDHAPQGSSGVRGRLPSLGGGGGGGFTVEMGGRCVCMTMQWRRVRAL